MSVERFCSCPYCDSVFRLSDGKLKHHAGMVRCGACREVFDANTNLVEKTQTGLMPVAQTNEDFHSDEELGISNEIAPDQGTVESETLRQNDDFDVFEYHEVNNPFDERNPDGLSNEDSQQQINLNNSDEGFNYEIQSEPVIESLDFDPDQSINIELKDNDEMEASTEDSTIESSMLGENYDGSGVESEVDRQFLAMKIKYVDADEDSIYSGMSSMSQLSALEDSTLGRINRNGVNEYISDRSNPLMTFTWTLVAIAFVVLLGMQVKYFFVEKYAQNETYRKYLVGFCKIAKCDLAPRQDPFRFTLTHTKIDLHPTQLGALRVTVKLVNEATFSQPYPLLQLTLTDRVGRIVGRRTFSPEFYLQKGKPNMIDQEELASILFDLARPHEKAVGFVVDIVTEPVSS